MKFPFVRRKRLKVAIAEYESLVQQLNGERSAYQGEMESVRATHAHELNVLRAEMNVLRAEINEQSAELNELRHRAVQTHESVYQIQGHNDLRPLFALKLAGTGIEIGALHNPLPVSPGVTVKYVDRFTREENIARTPAVNAEQIVETSYVCDGQSLPGVPDESQDFVIANHMLEHCVNPLMALENFLRVLKPEGRMFITLPDKRFIFDFKRPATTWDHVLQDYRMGREVEDRSVYEEYRDCVDPTMDVEMAVVSRLEIHHHTWTQAEMLELFIQAKRVLGWPLEIELFGKQGCEVVVVVQKADPPHQDHATNPPATQPVREPVKSAAPPATQQVSGGSAREYQVGSFVTDRVHVQIEETWSNDLEMGVRGFALVKSGVPQDVRITYEGNAPVMIDWEDRPEVYAHAIFAGYARHVRCGFRAAFRRRAIHPIAATLLRDGVDEAAGSSLPATGYAPIPPTEPAGMSLPDFAVLVNRECRSVLEIGSRIVSPGSESKRRFFDPKVRYTGFDIYADSNTDVVGDAHALSGSFPPGTQFDAIFSLAVLEHIAMPWKVALEINKLLPIGGLSYHSTPFTWPLHETPWDFWRFSHEGLRMLFSPALGFEVLSLGLTGPCRIHFEQPEGALWHTPFHPTFAESNILVRKVRDYSAEDFQWNVRLEEVLPGQSCYPPPAGHAS